VKTKKLLTRRKICDTLEYIRLLKEIIIMNNKPKERNYIKKYMDYLHKSKPIVSPKKEYKRSKLKNSLKGEVYQELEEDVLTKLPKS